MYEDIKRVLSKSLGEDTADYVVNILETSTKAFKQVHGSNMISRNVYNHVMTALAAY